jgi:hypothetical protein
MDDQLTDAQEAYRQLSNALNRMDHTQSINEIVEMIDKDHRTQQQVLFRLFMAAITMWGLKYTKAEYDDRNKATCKYSCDIKTMSELEDWYIPFI